MTSGLLGYTGIAYSLQRMFYGEKFVSFNINATTKAPYTSILNFSGRNTETPYLRTLAGVEQDFSYLLQSSVAREHLPLLARYHALTAAQTFPLCFYENELPKANEVIELEHCPQG